MMDVSQTPVEQLNYEQASGELEEIVNALESAQISLEEAIALYERGQNLIKRCEELLDQADLHIRQLNPETPQTDEE
jgi:exodeoxyribonuclease VII small subunit